MHYLRYPLFVTVLLLGACSGRDDDTQGAATAGAPADTEYVVMDDSLTELKDDFNSRVDKVRFVFLVGPTCGICLRGMADLNDAFIEAMQGDPRFHVFVVHVPALGAKEKHVAQAIPLLDGPNVTHYWEDSGIIGMHYHDLLDVRAYVWDIWAIYRPGAVWGDTLPPEPDYWEHQLTAAGGPFTSDLELDAERYARVAKQMIDEVRDVSLVAEAVAQDATYADGLVIPKVAQPRGVAIQQHIMGRGGYQNLKRIEAVNFDGSIEANGTLYPLSIRTSRPGSIVRAIDDSPATYDKAGTHFADPDAPRGLPHEIESRLLDLFEFDGPLVEWKDKGHDTRMIGMRKVGEILAWELELDQNQGQRWTLLIDSHSGAIVEAYALDDAGGTMFSIHADDFKDVAGFMFPHRIEYRGNDGTLLASENIDRIDVITESFQIEQERVTH